jgi:hypothetical protein
MELVFSQAPPETGLMKKKDRAVSTGSEMSKMLPKVDVKQ